MELPELESWTRPGWGGLQQTLCSGLSSRQLQKQAAVSSDKPHVHSCNLLSTGLVEESGWSQGGAELDSCPSLLHPDWWRTHWSLGGEELDSCPSLGSQRRS